MGQELLLTKGDLTVDLGELLAGTEYGTQVLAGVTGLGLPDVSAQWFEGAGDGASWQGSQIGRAHV